MDRSQEEQWALALKKARHGIRHTSRIPLAERKEQLDTDMTKAKAALKQALKQKKETEVQTILTRLVELRAQQTGLALEVWQQQYGAPTQNIIRLYTRRFTEDCLHLADLVGRHLNR